MFLAVTRLDVRIEIAIVSFVVAVMFIVVYVSLRLTRAFARLLLHGDRPLKEGIIRQYLCNICGPKERLPGIRFTATCRGEYCSSCRFPSWSESPRSCCTHFDRAQCSRASATEPSRRSDGNPHTRSLRATLATMPGMNPQGLVETIVKRVASTGQNSYFAPPMPITANFSC